MRGLRNSTWPTPPSIFRFRKRKFERTRQFNVVLLVPTGIGAELGGHAGDAEPVASLLGAVADKIVLHPNVVNASDINEMPRNALYVEGSIMTRLLMGTAGLQPVRANKVLVVLDAHRDDSFIHAAINAVNAARSSYGLSCPEIVCLQKPLVMSASSAPSGRAAERIEGMDGLFQLLLDRIGLFDAVAISTIIGVPFEFHQTYFDSAGSMVNPWGGVEAMLTHTLSSAFKVPTAHSPMLESKAVAEIDPGIVDPRMAAEAYSSTFLQCILKGLRVSPRIVTGSEGVNQHGVLAAEDISCLVIPEGCLGLPTLAALEQEIPVIAVAENWNLMRNNLSLLPWKTGQFYQVDNYLEAAGVLAALRQGIDVGSVRGPLNSVRITRARARNTPHRYVQAESMAARKFS